MILKINCIDRGVNFQSGKLIMIEVNDNQK